MVPLWHDLLSSCTPGRHQKKPVWISGQWFDGRATRGCHIATIVSLHYNGTEVFKRSFLCCIVEFELTEIVGSILGRLDVVVIIESVVAIGDAAEVFTIAGLEGNFAIGE